MEYTPFSLLNDVTWISVFMVIGVLLRRGIPAFRSLLIPAPITAGIIGLVLGPHVIGWVGFSEHLTTYTTVLIAVVFGALPYSMNFDQGIRRGARVMWSYSTGMLVLQWGVFVLLGLALFQPVWDTEPWFGMMLPAGFVGGFGVAAAVGGSLDDAGAQVATSLGFTSATVGTFAAIIGGIIFARWGIKHGKTSQVPSKLPFEMRSGYIPSTSERPAIGKATTNPSSVESLTLHAGIVVLTVGLAHLLSGAISDLVPGLDIPLFAMAFILGAVGRLILNATGLKRAIDDDTINTFSGTATDYVIAFGIASIVPAAISAYLVPLILMLVLGIVFCLFFFFIAARRYFGEQWFERGLFGWGWTTAAVANALAILRIVDPCLKSGTLSEFGMAYVGFVPFEISLVILAPLAAIAGWTLGFGVATLVIGLAILALPWVLRWLPHQRAAS